MAPKELKRACMDPGARAAVVQQLLLRMSPSERRAALEETDGAGSTVLHVVAECGSQDSANIVRVLVDQRADVAARNKKQCTALNSAIYWYLKYMYEGRCNKEEGCRSVVEVLEGMGAPRAEAWDMLVSSKTWRTTVNRATQVLERRRDDCGGAVPAALEQELRRLRDLQAELGRPPQQQGQGMQSARVADAEPRWAQFPQPARPSQQPLALPAAGRDPLPSREQLQPLDCDESGDSEFIDILELQADLHRTTSAGATKSCAACGHVGAASDRFCGLCGAAMPIVCSCGRVSAAGMRFCVDCGTPLAGLSGAEVHGIGGKRDLGRDGAGGEPSSYKRASPPAARPSRCQGK